MSLQLVIIFCVVMYNLMKIDLSPLSHVTSIGNYFLCNCISLTEIDLSPLSHVTSIGDDFLSNCLQLKDIKYTGNNKIIIEKIKMYNNLKLL